MEKRDGKLRDRQLETDWKEDTISVRLLVVAGTDPRQRQSQPIRQQPRVCSHSSLLGLLSDLGWVVVGLVAGSSDLVLLGLLVVWL